jgi:hypothetical protein
LVLQKRQYRRDRELDAARLRIWREHFIEGARTAPSTSVGVWGLKVDRMTESVVDLLEAIEVEAKHGDLLTARDATQRTLQQLEPVPDRRDPKLLQSLMRQARKNRLINFVFAECLLVLFEAKAPQPTPKSTTPPSLGRSHHQP